MFPETFNKWCECIDCGNLNELDLSKYCLAVVQFGNELKLSTSLCKTSWKDEIYLIQVVVKPQEEEDEQEKKDLDFTDKID